MTEIVGAERERESNGVTGAISSFESSQKWRRRTASLPYSTHKYTHFSASNPDRASLLGHHVAAVEGRPLRPTWSSRFSYQVQFLLDHPQKLLELLKEKKEGIFVINLILCCCCCCCLKSGRIAAGRSQGE